MTSHSNPMEFWIDVGGTFTDCLAAGPDGVRRIKVLSSSAILGRGRVEPDGRAVVDLHLAGLPNDLMAGYQARVREGDGPGRDLVVAGSDSGGRVWFSQAVAEPGREVSFELTAHEPAPVLGIRLLSGFGLAEPIGPVRVKLGTTRGTNAFLERKGGPVGLITTAGFADLPLIGTQARPQLFEWNITRPEPLFEAVAVTGFDYAIDKSAVQHILKKHSDDGTEARRGQRAVAPDDFGRLPRVLGGTKSIAATRLMDAKGNPAVQITDESGEMATIWEVRRKRKMLALGTLWLKKKGGA